MERPKRSPGGGPITKRGARVALLAMALIFAIQTGAASEIIRVGNLVIDVDARLVLKEHDAKRFVPGIFSLDADLSTTTGAAPPMPNHVVFDFDRNVKATNLGAPVCPADRLEGATVAAARASCRKAILGTGRLTYLVTPAEGPPLTASSEVTAFNGPSQGLNGVVLFHAYLPVPAPTSYVTQMTVSRVKKGPYRTEVVADPPPIAGGLGHITHFDITVHKEYRYKGFHLSFFSVRCKFGGFVAHGQGSFADGTFADGLVFVPCGKKRR